MTTILTTMLSILVIAGLAWIAKKMLRVPICPICLGVGGTWLWMIVGRSLGYAVDTALLSILLGGSVVGIAYQIEQRLPPGRSPLLWKMLFIPVGFVAAYALARAEWILFAVVSIGLALLTVLFVMPSSSAKQESKTVEELKEKMRKCC